MSGVEKWLTRQLHKLKVEGSNPSPATIYASIAQVAERLICNQQVGRSIRPVGSVHPGDSSLPASRGRANLEVRSWDSPAEFTSCSF